MALSSIFGRQESQAHLSHLPCRLYPVIYFPALLLYSLSRIPPILRHQSSHSAASFPLMLSLRKHHHHLVTASNKEKSNTNLERINLLLKRLKISPIHSTALPSTIQFFLSALVAFLIPAVISYRQYGDLYLREAILYHIGRYVINPRIL
jgi:hypothetical protein